LDALAHVLDTNVKNTMDGYAMLKEQSCSLEKKVEEQNKRITVLERKLSEKKSEIRTMEKKATELRDKKDPAHLEDLVKIVIAANLCLSVYKIKCSI